MRSPQRYPSLLLRRTACTAREKSKSRSARRARVMVGALPPIVCSIPGARSRWFAGAPRRSRKISPKAHGGAPANHLLLAPGMEHMIGGNAQNITLARLAEQGFDFSRAVHAVRRNKREGYLCGDRMHDHPARDLRFRRKTHIIRHMRRRHAFGIVRPCLRQIKRPVDEGVAMARHIGREHTDLAIGDLARRARILARNAARRLALFQKAGLVDDKNRLLISQGFQRIIAHHVAQRFRVPPAATQDRLLTPRAEIPSRFRAHPARLARFAPKQPIQEIPCRRSDPLLAEQRTNPRLHIPQRGRPKPKRRLNRCSDHPCPPESWGPMDSEPKETCNCNVRFLLALEPPQRP